HVANSDGCGGRLAIDELPQVTQLRAEDRIRCVVDEDEEVEASAISLSRSPVGHAQTLIATLHDHVVASDVGQALSVGDGCGNRHGYGNGIVCRSSFGMRPGD